MSQRSDHRPAVERAGKSAFVQRAEYLVYRSFARLLSSASEARVDWWGTRIGRLARRLLGRRTRLAMRNLALAFPEKTEDERREIAYRCWEHYGRTTLSYVRSFGKPVDAIVERFEILGREHIDRALALGRGMILLTPHLGSWEFAIGLLAQLERPSLAVARPLDNQLLERDLKDARRHAGLQTANRRRAARHLVRALEKSEIVILLPDQAVKPREGILVPFLGRDAWTTTAPARLALRFGSPIVVIAAVPTESGFIVEIDPPIVPAELPEDRRTIEAITRAMNDQISAKIRRYPSLWLWMHDRWKGPGAGSSTRL